MNSSNDYRNMNGSEFNKLFSSERKEKARGYFIDEYVDKNNPLPVSSKWCSNNSEYTEVKLRAPSTVRSLINGAKVKRGIFKSGIECTATTKDGKQVPVELKPSDLVKIPELGGQPKNKSVHHEIEFVDKLNNDLKSIMSSPDTGIDLVMEDTDSGIKTVIRGVFLVERLGKACLADVVLLDVNGNPVGHLSHKAGVSNRQQDSSCKQKPLLRMATKEYHRVIRLITVPFQTADDVLTSKGKGGCVGYHGNPLLKYGKGKGRLSGCLYSVVNDPRVIMASKFGVNYSHNTPNVENCEAVIYGTVKLLHTNPGECTMIADGKDSAILTKEHYSSLIREGQPLPPLYYQARCTEDSGRKIGDIGRLREFIVDRNLIFDTKGGVKRTCNALPLTNIQVMRYLIETSKTIPWTWKKGEMTLKDSMLMYFEDVVGNGIPVPVTIINELDDCLKDPTYGIVDRT